MCVHNQKGACLIDPVAGNCNPDSCPFADAEDRELGERIKREAEDNMRNQGA